MTASYRTILNTAALLYLVLPSYAQIITAAPTGCVTATVTALPTSCSPPALCPAICYVDITTLTQPCSCATPIPTITETAPCHTCPNCPGTTIIAPCTKSSSATPCPVVTQTEGPGCSIPQGCVVPECILLSTVDIPCGCTGIETKTKCATGCPGCETLWTGLYEPCPTVSPT